jgi:hypothetical protein
VNILAKRPRNKAFRRPAGHGVAILTRPQREEWLAIFREWERAYRQRLGNLVTGLDPRFTNVARLDKPIEWGLMLRNAFEVLERIAEDDLAAAERERQMLEDEHPQLTRLYAIDAAGARSRMKSVYKALGNSDDMRRRSAPPMAFSVYDVPLIADYLHDEIWRHKTGVLTADQHRLLLRDALLGAHAHAVERFRMVEAATEPMPPEIRRNMIG